MEKEIEKSKELEPEIVYKEIHGQLVPVKVYPTVPLEDKFDNFSFHHSRGFGPQDYTRQVEVNRNIVLEYLAKLK